MESNKKTSIKTITWEIFHLVVLSGIIFIFTGEWEYATFGALLYIAFEAAGYFVHERLWARFGKGIK
jgi:uncharacterized membrane protein